MKNNKGFAPLVVLLIVLGVLVVGGVSYFAGKNTTPKNEVSDNSNYFTTTQQNNMPSEQNANNNSQNSQTQNNTSNISVIDQPAYLIKAYSKNSKNYIDVDYIEVLSGNASIQAQVADGKCPSVNDCYDFPNGYKRNQNPQVRTFEVSPNVIITSSWDPYPDKNQITFQQFQNSQSWYPITTQPPFQQVKGPYITIDVQNNLVTEIIRPYQE